MRARFAALLLSPIRPLVLPPPRVCMRIEVEKKFEPPSDLAALGHRIAELGGTMVGEKAFTDTYYDTATCTLTRRDTWLRSRDGAWELKVPIDTDTGRSGGERTVFREVEGTAEVNAALHKHLVTELDGIQPHAIEETLNVAGVVPFAEFTTTRTKWSLDGASLDSDVASFGHAVMEIEVMVSEETEVAKAEALIANVAERIGVRPLGALGGKLETYIRRHAPAVLEALVAEGILRPND